MLATGLVVLRCFVEGFPIPTVSWVMVDNDGNQITLTSEGSIIIIGGATAFERRSILIISRTDLTLNGVYVCVATNEVGSINASAVLTVNGEYMKCI